MADLHAPSDEALGAALITLERFPWRWWQLRLRRDTDLRRRLARTIARRVEATVLRAARENPPAPEPCGLPPYSGDRALCVKCGYGPGSVARSAYRRQESAGHLVEFLTRTCIRCGFEWREQCAVAATAPGTAQPTESESALGVQPEPIVVDGVA